jgi:hypothetical protein
MSSFAEQLAMLRLMYAKGVTSMEQGGEKVAFASGEELRRRIAELEGLVNAKSDGGGGAQGIHYPEFDRGF